MGMPGRRRSRLSSNAKVRELFSRCCGKIKGNHSREFSSARKRRCQTRSVLFSFSPSMLSRPSNVDNKRGPAWRARDFSMKGMTGVRKACYTRTAFVKLTQKSIQVIQVRQFQELRELVPLFLQRISRVASNKFSRSRYFILWDRSL